MCKNSFEKYNSKVNVANCITEHAFQIVQKNGLVFYEMKYEHLSKQPFST
jgi:hypothetical protein